MKDELRKPIEDKYERRLINNDNFSNVRKFDSSRYKFIEKSLTGTWLSKHEDLVNTIYLENLIADRFLTSL